MAYGGLSTQVLNKILSVYVRLRHGNVPGELRYFYRDTYYCQVAQWKYLLRDYVFKNKYKVTSWNGEFGAELLFALPFAYWHHQNGTLKKTRSSTFTKELYFFSEQHEEVFNLRITQEKKGEGNYNYEMPRILHSHDYNMSKWAPVPLKEAYRNDVYVYEKPLLIIANRYNMEWDGPPVSFFDKPALKFMIEGLKDTYTIIYNRPRPQDITPDNSAIYDLHEHDWIRANYPEVIMLEDLWKKNEGNARSFNHLQFMVYANADHFISIHGGTATLASYFGGTNLIYSKKGLEHHFGCFETLFPKLSGARILVAKTEQDLRNLVTQNFIQPKPIGSYVNQSVG